MKSYIKHDEWRVVESGFHAEFNEITESLMSLGNGKMGQRGNFEERYSGKRFKEIMWQVFGFQTKQEWVGGKTGTLIISQK